MFFVTVRPWPHYYLGTCIRSFWNQVAWKTSPLAGYCTMSKVEVCWMLEIRAAQKFRNGQYAWVTQCSPYVFCSILFYGLALNWWRVKWQLVYIHFGDQWSISGGAVHLFLLVSSHLNQANYGPTFSFNLTRKLVDDIRESDHLPFPLSQ